MGDRYLTGLADWCRGAGLEVTEVDAWRRRARSSGGYDPGRPWCVMWHHTASKTTPANDVAYMVSGNPVAPVANLYLARTGAVWVMAAGATNTNGKGGPLTVSHGTIPTDQMNTYAVSVEAANNGIGEVWPADQIDAYFTLNNLLAANLGLAPADLCTHTEWAPTRKIDPAKAEAVAGGWVPRPANASGSWRLSDVRAEAAARAGTTPAPEPLPPVPVPAPTEVIDMVVAIDVNGTAWVGDGIHREPIGSEPVFFEYVRLGRIGAYRFVNTDGGAVAGWADVRAVSDVTLDALGAES